MHFCNSLEASRRDISNEYPQHVFMIVENNSKTKYAHTIHVCHKVELYSYLHTVKSLTDARAFIRIITFHEEGDGRLLEAIETCKSHMKVQNDQFLSNGRHLVFSENDW